EDPAFVGDGASFSVHTRWIDDEFLLAAEADDGTLPTSVTILIGGRPHTVALPGLALLEGPSAASVLEGIRSRASATAGGSGQGGPAVLAPTQGTIGRLAGVGGRAVAAGDLLAAVEPVHVQS